MLAATGEYRLFMDADYSTPIPEVEKLLASVDKYEVIIGSRYLDKKSIKVRQPFKRRLISRTCNLLIQAMVLPGVKDTQCGFKLFSAEAAERIFPKLKMTGWSFDIEVLAIARQLGYRINEVPVNWFDAKFSRLNASRAAAASFIGDLMTITQRFRRQAYR
jgi:dolichyl-phosphate beta-glucosyltransferase